MLRPLGRAFPALFPACLLATPSCAPRGAVKEKAPEVWVTGTFAAIDEMASAGPLSTSFGIKHRPIELAGAVNETVAFQFVLPGADDDQRGLEIECEALVSPSGRIPREAVRIYRQWPISIHRYPNWYLRSVGLRRPREIPDALVPIRAANRGEPFTPAPGGQRVFWVEIRIPFATRPGSYEGALVLRDAEGHARRTPIALSVQDFLLTTEDAITILARIQLEPIISAHTNLDPENLRQVLHDPKGRQVLLRTFEILREHGLSPFTDEVSPRFYQDLDGKMALDWTDYDDFCGGLIDGSALPDGRPAAAWPLPVDAKHPDPALYTGTLSTVYMAALKEYMAAVARHFEEKGWLDRSYVFFDLPTPVNPRESDLKRVRQFATLAHFVEPRLRFVSRLTPQPMAGFGWFEHVHRDLTSVIDIWSTPARYLHAPTLAHLQTLGKRTWLMPDRPPFSGSLAVEAPPVHARSLPWQAFIQNHEAIMLDRVTDWPNGVFETPITDRRQRSDTWLLYPGTMFGLDEPIPSVRLKQLQQGIQDYQRLQRLKKHGRSETARHLIAGSLIKATGTDAYGDNYQDGLLERRVDDPALWRLARRLLDRELADALSSDTAPGSNARGTRADWVRFLSATRRIAARYESARIKLDDRPHQEGFLATYEVAIRSELRTPLEGTLTFGNLPPGGGSVSDVVSVGPVREMGMERKRLVAALAELPPTDLDGHYVQPIEFDAGPSGRVDIRATASLVQAPRAPFPITVDGRLDDWPPNDLNAAGDFRLIGDGSVSGEDRPRAQSQTIAYFSRDDRNLYIGIHAGAPRGKSDESADPPRLRNTVKYEDLMPVGDDLIEILIDPTNAATQSGDLYHIVLKSTGIAVFERGIGTDPPIGATRPWPGMPPRCEVAGTAYGWSAEVAIPLSAFGPQATENFIWGVNLARLEPVRGEYSDWARASRYCYDPRTLGNLVWQD